MVDQEREEREFIIENRYKDLELLESEVAAMLEKELLVIGQ